MCASAQTATNPRRMLPAMDAVLNSPTTTVATTAAAVGAELAAFVAGSISRRPGSWSCVQRLQRACLVEKPATLEGYAQADSLLTPPSLRVEP